MKALFIVLFFTITSSSCFAYEKKLSFDIDSDLNPFYQISEIVVKEIPVEDSRDDHDVIYNNNKSDLAQIALVIDGMIAIGKKVWPIIEAGRPVVDVNMANQVSVIPFKNDDVQSTFERMENWSAPVAKKYNVTYKNGFKMSVISFDYTVIFQYGGSYQGLGKFLTGVNVVASNITVAWGFDFNATSQLIQISNHGTLEDKVAGATFRVNYTASSFLKTIKSQDTFHVMGDGRLQKL